MNTLETDSEIELAAEIDDLYAYLRDVPADLRKSGAFASYELRLQQLLETLLTLRLKQTLHRYESRLAEKSISSEQRTAYEEILQWVLSAERRHEEAAQDYLRVTTLLNNLVVALEQR